LEKRPVSEPATLEGAGVEVPSLLQRGERTNGEKRLQQSASPKKGNLVFARRKVEGKKRCGGDLEKNSGIGPLKKETARKVILLPS